MTRVGFAPSAPEPPKLGHQPSYGANSPDNSFSRGGEDDDFLNFSFNNLASLLQRNMEIVEKGSTVLGLSRSLSGGAKEVQRGFAPAAEVENKPSGAADTNT